MLMEKTFNNSSLYSFSKTPQKSINHHIHSPLWSPQPPLLLPSPKADLYPGIKLPNYSLPSTSFLTLTPNSAHAKLYGHHVATARRDDLAMANLRPMTIFTSGYICNRDKNGCDARRIVICGRVFGDGVVDGGYVVWTTLSTLCGWGKGEGAWMSLVVVLHCTEKSLPKECENW